ncbi:MAG TPA: sensor histidine kinase, partial [Gemmatimonadales bacterium]|nr:sensor histidine kinase [Gemmatimonadales bacterium]
PGAGHRTRLFGMACAVVVGLIGLLSLTEYILNRDLGIDQLFIQDLTTIWTPGRPGANSAFQFFVLSLALLLGSSRQLSAWLAESFGLIVLLGAFIVLLGYLYSAAELTNDISPTQMALNSAVVFIALAAGVLARDSSGPVTQVLTSPGPGGSLARKLLPRLIIAIVVIGFLRLTGERLGWYGLELGLSLFVLMTTIVIIFVTLRYARATDEAQLTRIEADRKVRDAFAQVRTLAATAEKSREAERTRIAREIHDELGQALTGVKMDLAWVRSRLPADRAIQERFDAVGELLEDAVQIGRRISSDLRPGVLDDLGLVAALQWQAREFTKRTGIAVRIDAPDDVPVPDERATAAFRICQEALTNVSRHSGATRVQVEVTAQDQALSVVIQDNGRGFDVGPAKAGSFGLLGMQERAEAWGGAVRVESNVGGGTTVTLSLPLGEVTA